MTIRTAAGAVLVLGIIDSLTFVPHAKSDMFLPLQTPFSRVSKRGKSVGHESTLVRFARVLSFLRSSPVPHSWYQISGQSQASHRTGEYLNRIVLSTPDLVADAATSAHETLPRSRKLASHDSQSPRSAWWVAVFVPSLSIADGLFTFRRR